MCVNDLFHHAIARRLNLGAYSRIVDSTGLVVQYVNDIYVDKKIGTN